MINIDIKGLLKNKVTGKLTGKVTGKLPVNIDMVRDIMDKTEEELSNMPPSNIMIIGKTGAGKSTLINAVFRNELVKTGIGKPVTEHLKKINVPGIPLNLFDTRGIELSEKAQEEVRVEILDEINRREKTGDERDRIHCIWYVVNAASNRIEDFEITWINSLSRRAPLIVVLTQSYDEENSKLLENYIREQNTGAVNVRRVISKEMKFGNFTIESKGLKELVNETLEIIPENSKNSFINAQKVDLDKKTKAAEKWAKGFITETFLVGFIPIPFADAPIIAASQVSMLAKITAIFGVSRDKAVITSVVSSIAGVGSAITGGRAIVTNLLKLVPGAGTVATGLISGTTAATITFAMAEAYIKVMRYVCEQEYQGNEVKDGEIVKIMKRELSKYLDSRENKKD